MIRTLNRQLERLRSEDGQAMVFVALVGLIVFLFLAMTMNVAELVNTKIKNQNVADATALSAAVWQARVLNLVAATNRNMLELWAVGLPLSQTCMGTGLLCEFYVCGEFAVDPLPCIACLAITYLQCDAALSFLAGAVTTGVFAPLRVLMRGTMAIGSGRHKQNRSNLPQTRFAPGVCGPRPQPQYALRPCPAGRPTR